MNKKWNMEFGREETGRQGGQMREREGKIRIMSYVMT